MAVLVDPAMLPRFNQALELAVEMLSHSDLEVRSALKEAASATGVLAGDDTGRFIEWAEAKIFGAPYESRVVPPRKDS